MTAKNKKTELIFLGTGNAMAINYYNSCFAIRNSDQYFLVDAGGGNGIMKQIRDTGIPYSSISDMFVTHSHPDHILGVVWVVRQIAEQLSLGNYPGVFNVYGNSNAIAVVQTLLAFTLPEKLMKPIGKQILLTKVTDEETKEVAGMPVYFFDIHSTKKKQFGFWLELPSGQRFTCLGDEPLHKSCRKYAKNADWLLANAFCLERDKKEFDPYEKQHSTVLDAATTAQELKVKNLVLYHTEDTHPETRKKEYTAEARKVFTGQVFVPEDLEKIPLE